MLGGLPRWILCVCVPLAGLSSEYGGLRAAGLQLGSRAAGAQAQTREAFEPGLGLGTGGVGAGTGATRLSSTLRAGISKLPVGRVLHQSLSSTFLNDLQISWPSNIPPQRNVRVTRLSASFVAGRANNWCSTCGGRFR
ncbi:hypothetical protein B0H15DRAFT_858109 [Mycena belliarum]|uniref:Uncharacterized protein n=1 Tax=Mycena belliarum TaxID=1033014 RepID=A0AAD6TUL1_9AGAR|nr:hypothetical protein B0H15DRAFT_858109 [Mycena belliae]